MKYVILLLDTEAARSMSEAEGQEWYAEIGAWPSASDMFLAASVSSSRMTYFTVASRFLRSVSDGAPRGRPRISSTNATPPFPTVPRNSFQAFRPLAVSRASTVRTPS